MPESLKVIIIEDDPDVRLGCEQALLLEGIITEGVSSAEEGKRRISKDFRGVIVSDIRLPGMDGMTFLLEIQAIDPELPVVMITGHGDISTAVQAMKNGAHDFIQKPFSPEYFVEVVRRALEKRRLILEVRDLRSRISDRDRIEERLIGNSPGIARVRALTMALTDSVADILIQGETGTGKELVARCLHDAGTHYKGNFVAINCGGLPETLFDSEIFGHEAGAYTGADKRRIGKIEHANGGTLFLDEIESMPILMQIKLLRVLQERTVERLGSNTLIPINCRIIAATKEDLFSLSEKGRFRPDLYYRLNVAPLPLPPLRERREDIPLLFQHFLLQAAARHGKAVPVTDLGRFQMLIGYSWPGNVRELKNVAERCVLGIEYGAPPFGNETDTQLQSLAETVESFERALIIDALRRNNGSLSRSAETLAIAKTTLFDKIRKYGLSDIGTT